MFWWPGCDVEIRGLRPDYCLPVFGVQTDEQMSWAINSTVELLRNDSTDFVGKSGVSCTVTTYETVGTVSQE